MRFFLGLILLLVSIGGCNAVTAQRDKLDNVAGTVLLVIILFIVSLTLIFSKNEKYT
jgi:hypothetical protein